MLTRYILYFGTYELKVPTKGWFSHPGKAGHFMPKERKISQYYGLMCW